MESQSPMDFEIFDKLAVFTFELGPRSKVIAANESQYYDSFMSKMQTESPSLINFNKHVGLFV